MFVFNLLNNLGRATKNNQNEIFYFYWTLNYIRSNEAAKRNNFAIKTLVTEPVCLSWNNKDNELDPGSRDNKLAARRFQ